MGSLPWTFQDSFRHLCLTVWPLTHRRRRLPLPHCRHNRRRVPEHKCVVHCPLDRTLAIVPRDMLPEDVLLLATTTGSQAPTPRGSSTGVAATAGASGAPADVAGAVPAAGEEVPVADRPSYIYFGRFALRF